ncbi:MAG: ABC transporter substrate-binding protein [Aquabacterium sp.]|nr:ABC transporter substrate-binding protein [Aquabacterium sp.]MBI3383316.1 ABC transporter substrate-binding protein [Aquabacterium sp.]
MAIAASLTAMAAQAADNIHLGNLRFAHYGAVSYMKEVCPKYGINVAEHVFAKGPDIMPAIVAGDIDLAALASDGAIAGRANGVPIYAVAGFAQGGARMVVGKDTPIRSLRELKGKRVGVTRGGAQELLLYAVLDKAGLSWSTTADKTKDIEVVFLPFADLNQALAAKQIDAMMQSEPQSSQAIRRQIGRELLKPYDTALGQPKRLLVMSERLYRNRELALRVVKCFVDATAQFVKSPAMAEQYVRERMFRNELTHDEFQDAIGNAPYSYDVSLAHIDTTTELMKQFGVGRLSSPPKAWEWTRLDLLTQAKRELQIP